MIRIELPWIPREELRGNSRAHFQVKARYASELQERGIAYGACRQAWVQPSPGLPDHGAAGPGHHGVEQAPDRL